MKNKDQAKLNKMLGAYYTNALRRGDKEQAELLKRAMKKIKL